RFLLILALAYLLLAGLGVQARVDFEPSAWCTNTRQSGCSVFTIGKAMLERCNYDPEELLRRVRYSTEDAAPRGGGFSSRPARGGDDSAATMDEQQLRERIAELEAENAELRRRLAQVEHELQKIRQRGKRPRSGRNDPKGARADHRRKEHRKHPGSFRPEPPP